MRKLGSSKEVHFVLKSPWLFELSAVLRNIIAHWFQSSLREIENPPYPPETFWGQTTQFWVITNIITDLQKSGFMWLWHRGGGIIKCSSHEHYVAIITEGNEVPFSLMPGLLGPALLKMCVLLIAADTGLIPRGRTKVPSLGDTYRIEGNVDMSAGNVSIRWWVPWQGAGRWQKTAPYPMWVFVEKSPERSLEWWVGLSHMMNGQERGPLFVG